MKENGYNVIEDNQEIDENTFFLVLEKGIYPQSEIYYKTEELILPILNKYNIDKPETFAFTQDISNFQYSFVVKNELEHGGKDKYLIKNEDNFNDFINSNNNYQDYVIQRYINTPTRYNTSLRVITSASGDILCSSLLYAENSLKNESIVSNVLSGGHGILLEKDYYSEFEQQILSKHNINIYTGFLPDNVHSACTLIAEKLNRYLGAICGFDFIYCKEEQKWYYLECHDFPMLFPYVECYNLPYKIPTANYADKIDFSQMLNEPNQIKYLNEYVEQVLNSQLADYDARLNALSMYMHKKKGKNKIKKVII